MAGVKIINFLGTAPKISPELLPNWPAFGRGWARRIADLMGA